MDKELGIIVLFVIGAVLLLVIISVYGMLKNAMDKAKSNRNNDLCVCNSGPDRECNGMDRHTHSTEEMIQVLQVLRMGACRYEREILNELIDMLEKGDDDVK